MSVLSSFSRACLLSKYEGCLLGALLGDCFGAKFEGITHVPLSEVLLHVKPDSDRTTRQSILGYTDDTAMTRSVANSLIQCNAFSAEDMAEMFQSEYFKDPNRGYGGNVVQVFCDLMQKTYSDVYESSKRQFDGSGSYGNGAAMRVAPVALFAAENVERIVEIARDSARLTHSNVDGYNGAILQCLAVYQALGSEEPVDPLTFISDLMRKYGELAADEDKQQQGQRDINKPTYLEKLRMIESYFSTTSQPNIPVKEIRENLGHHISAKGSVPTAIYCFLRTLNSIENAKELNGWTEFARCLMYAISLGGDTDTITSMACSIAGAHYGRESIPSQWVGRCEGDGTAIEQAGKLLDLALQHQLNHPD